MHKSFRFERRQHPRLRLAPMYCALTARAQRIANEMTGQWEGHIYDVSEGGARIELDAKLDIGTWFNLDMHLTGAAADIRATAVVVRMISDRDEPGPWRLGIRFSEFGSAADHAELQRFCGRNVMRQAA